MLFFFFKKSLPVLPSSENTVFAKPLRSPIPPPPRGSLIFPDFGAEKNKAAC